MSSPGKYTIQLQHLGMHKKLPKSSPQDTLHCSKYTSIVIAAAASRWGSLQRSPDRPVAKFKGADSQRRGRVEWRGQEGRYGIVVFNIPLDTL